MSKTPKPNLVIFPANPARPSGVLVPNSKPLLFGRFTAAECEEVAIRFHENGEPIKKLAIAFSVGNSLIEALIRVPRKPMASSQQKDRRGRKAA